MSKSIVNSRIETPLDAAAAIALARVLIALYPGDESDFAFELYTDARSFAYHWARAGKPDSCFFSHFEELADAYDAAWIRCRHGDFLECPRSGACECP